MTTPEVSVCIRAHARTDHLRLAIQSVLAQTFRDFEVVVSDDSGRLGEIAAAFGDPRIRYHANGSPKGPAANLAHAMSLGRGRLLAILNDDDEWLPDFLSVVVDRFRRDAALGVVFTDYFFEIQQRRFRHRLPMAPGRHDRFLRELLLHSMPGSATVIRRAAWEAGERTHPLTPALVGDYTAWLRAAAAEWPFHYVGEPLGIIRIHQSQLSWNEHTLDDRTVATLESFRFDDPECEALRRARVCEFVLRRAHSHLRRGRLGPAGADIRRAFRMARGRVGVRGLLALSGVHTTAMRWGAAHPRALVVAMGAWRRVRPEVRGLGVARR